MADARPRLRDVAQRANTSLSLASYALNGSGRVSAETRERVLQAAHELGYRSNRYARMLRTGQREDIGVIIRNMRNPMFLDVLKALEEGSRARGQALLVTSSHYDAAEQQDLLDHLVDLGVGKIVIAPVGGLSRLRAWQERHQDIHLVALHADDGGDDPVPSVATVNPDHHAAVRLCVEYAAERGHRTIDFVAAPAEQAADTARETAFEHVCAEHGIEGVVRHTRLNAGVVADFLAEDLRSRHDHPCYLFNSDYLAAVAYSVATSMGRQVGRDLSVIGHDDLPTSALLAPALTTVAFDRSRVGAEALRLVIDGAKERVEVPVELRARDSVARLTD
ncbi:LacI family DNA-binding transcriptional regulator [Aeromicrobium phragmitis]|uniref:LacI family DNA-binding transcriptional regulator n=1 Tax=Aeromicrobium phragmitis TaxID=2478914 RepID=UPI00140CFF76|nr:LacI family DNA-binding transcriptional regulator [Aeromicrobium phragmitis]